MIVLIFLLRTYVGNRATLVPRMAETRVDGAARILYVPPFGAWGNIDNALWMRSNYDTEGIITQVGYPARRLSCHQM